MNEDLVKIFIQVLRNFDIKVINMNFSNSKEDIKYLNAFLLIIE